jgi:hypothetical protein
VDREVGIKFESWTGKWGSSLIGGLESGGDQAFKTDKSKKCKSASNTSFYLLQYKQGELQSVPLDKNLIFLHTEIKHYFECFETVIASTKRQSDEIYLIFA